MVITLDLKPFGLVAIEVYGAVVDGKPRVFAQVQNNPFVPVVSCSAGDAMIFGRSLYMAGVAAERGAAGNASSNLTPIS